MKVALITDQHLDGRKGSLAFWNFWQKFYDNVFFPTLEKHKVNTIIDLGDTFDNRKSMDFNTFQRAKVNYFDKLKDYKVHMLIGNHCTYYKNTNRINSPELLLEQYENIRIYSRPEHVRLGSKQFLMLPWINSENKEEILRTLEDSDADIVCGHLELTGFEVTPGMKMDHGMDPAPFKRFDRVWSGHYHHKSKKGNIQYLGNPYQMFWNDYKDKRGFHIYDTETDRLTFIENPYEIFQKLYYNDSEHQKIDYSQYKDCFVKVIVEEKNDYLQFEKVIDKLYDTSVNEVKIIESLVNETGEIDDDIEIKDTMTLLGEYVDEVEVSVDKKKLKKLLNTLYIESCEVV
jgi:DNA repair exonuclease SbcCD nuclease subunit